ncbi:MAG: NADH-quinone oxidoreductase subunit D [Chloroflexi bacterium AL-W]|nr:NADH-quinone oxidoreductase subunit D [Chloroflexi bacterium AL-N1]NOK70820.1 NADH-quinone oxidoreductase subunit D [Chloroflexi bacterium AL-N10]NOK78380.1 NADH-quinone oxidoreductase subunit D [Chloroflexi bacterium AL-N5]NOK85361.1 NADH-quinone oxidoreductase subunit D [Chloroflexi bacterium AL-W]NOK92637.1 NADH-quinone oxidoreductase subunit D [Chloroflexi bacterium AL-N15]
MTSILSLGPHHPAWDGPQRLIIRLNGERIVDVEYRDESAEPDYADQLTRADIAQALDLVARICKPCAFAHSLAFCQALEDLCEISVEDRAAYLRCAVVELERVVAHLQVVATLLNTLGMEPHGAKLLKIHAAAIQLLTTISGSHNIRDMILPGGVRRDLSDKDKERMLDYIQRVHRSLYRFTDSIIDHRALLMRTVDVGGLPRTAAEQFGVRGPLARASSLARDVRADQPYAAYDKLSFRIITQEGGDVYARLVVLLLEAFESVKLVEQAIQELPEGAWQGAIPQNIKAGQADSAVEGPTGLVRYSLESDGYHITQARISVPRQLDRLLVRTLLSGGLIDNAVPIVASCAPSLACTIQGY